MPSFLGWSVNPEASPPHSFLSPFPHPSLSITSPSHLPPLVNEEAFQFGLPTRLCDSNPVSTGPSTEEPVFRRPLSSLLVFGKVLPGIGIEVLRSEPRPRRFLSCLVFPVLFAFQSTTWHQTRTRGPFDRKSHPLLDMSDSHHNSLGKPPLRFQLGEFNCLLSAARFADTSKFPM